jgi:hypothetical protein
MSVPRQPRASCYWSLAVKAARLRTPGREDRPTYVSYRLLRAIAAFASCDGKRSGHKHAAGNLPRKFSSRQPPGFAVRPRRRHGAHLPAGSCGFACRRLLDAVASDLLRRRPAVDGIAQLQASSRTRRGSGQLMPNLRGVCGLQAVRPMPARRRLSLACERERR